MGAAGHQALSDGPRQFEVNLVSTLPAAREYSVIQKRGFVHQSVRIVENTVNTALWNRITRAKRSFHATPHSYVAWSPPQMDSRHYGLRPEMQALNKGLSQHQCSAACHK